MELYEHQQIAINKLHNGSILWGGVGTGKSITALAYFYTRVCGGSLDDATEMRNPKDLYIITTAKKRDSLDWETDALGLRITPRPEDNFHGITIKVDSWNNITKYEGVKDAFFIFDEQRLVGSGTWTKAFIKIAKHNGWILLSATPGDTWLDYIPVFIANGFYENRTAFKRAHVVYNTFSKFPKVDHYTGVHKLVRLRNQILVEMPYKRHTTRHHTDVWVDYDEETFNKAVNKRWHVYEQRPLRDVAELFVVMRKIVNSDKSRLKALRSLMTKHAKLIVFYNFDYELEILRSLHGQNSATSSHGLSLVNQGGTKKPGDEQTHTFAIAEWNGHRHQPIPKTDRWVYLVQYQAGSESWNCVETNAMVFYSLTYSYKMFHQAHGRIDRLNTPFQDLYYYTLMSKSAICRAIVRALGQKKNFNESDFMGQVA